MVDEAVFRQLFVSRIAMFAFFLVFASGLIYEGHLAPFPTLSGAPMEETIGWSAVGMTLLWLSWRNWRLGVRLTSTDVYIMGVFRDRKIPRDNVVDVTPFGQLVWIAPAGDVKVSQLLAFTGIPGALAGIVLEHNERTLARLQEELVGPPVAPIRSAAPAGHRSYDSPTYRRRRDRSGPAKRTGRRRVLRDAWPAILQLLGWVLGAALAAWMAVEPALWLAGHQSDALGSTLGLAPYTESSAIEAAIFWGLAASVLTGIVIRLAYLMLRPGRGRMLRD